jgi:hypothetical protein
MLCSFAYFETSRAAEGERNNIKEAKPDTESCVSVPADRTQVIVLFRK